jgi:hypothetical protein
LAAARSELDNIDEDSYGHEQLALCFVVPKVLMPLHMKPPFKPDLFLEQIYKRFEGRHRTFAALYTPKAGICRWLKNESGRHELYPGVIAVGCH